MVAGVVVATTTEVVVDTMEVEEVEDTLEVTLPCHPTIPTQWSY